MHDDRRLVEGRIRRELQQHVFAAMHRARAAVSVTARDLPGEPLPFSRATAVDSGDLPPFEPFQVGSRWGRPWGTTWFRIQGSIPTGWTGEAELVVDLGFRADAAGFQSEGLVYTADGRAVQGIHPRRPAVALHDLHTDGAIDLYVEAAANPTFAGFAPSAFGSLSTAPAVQHYSLVRCEIAELVPEVFHLALDLEVLDGVMHTIAIGDPRRDHLLRGIERALDRLDLDDVVATAPAARAVLAEMLERPAHPLSLQTVAVGHAHIDTAWLWPIRETMRKCARTFASAVRMMDERPDYRFVCSQAQQYAWIEEQQPELFERIRHHVAGGQFVPVGGMWVEADMNLPSGESLIRQLVIGQREFERWFGQRCEEVWIPDVFGYPASLPQIFALGGCTRFITQKLSWNKQNVFPHSTFMWEGIDGTAVLTHFPPVDTYNATIVPSEVAYAETNFKDHGWSRHALMPFGYGNGGGGPTREMVERARRLADLDGSPPIRLGTPDEFFNAVEAEIAAGAQVPRWYGELYFEMHRGTYTSQVETKVLNRRAEAALRRAELAWSLCAEAVPADVAAELDAIWKQTLTQQFHDIIPGSSIAWVHEDAERILADSVARADALTATAFGAGESTVVLNCRTHRVDGEVIVVDRPSAALSASAGVETTPDGRAVVAVEVPGLGATLLRPAPLSGSVKTTRRSLDNGLLRVTLDDDGAIASLTDLTTGREVFAGVAGQLELAPDHPVEYDAWDLEHWTRRRAATIDASAVITTTVATSMLGEIRVDRSFGGSSAAVTYRLTAGSRRLDLELDIDWHESEQLLSIGFPVDVHAPEATCGIQFGHVRRPRHASSSWDAAKFEVCAHRWVDISEPSFGVAILNDGRFGHALQGDAVRVSLLRAAKFPDPSADQGRHRVRLAVLPHGAGLADVIRQAEAFEFPLTIHQAASAPQDGVAIDHPGVLASAVKCADDGSGDLVVRLHEALGDRATVLLGGTFASASRCGIDESAPASGEGELHLVGEGAELALRPFEIATVRLVRSSTG